MVTKICRYDGGVCSFNSCDVILPSGKVAVCLRHRNPRGRFMRRGI